MKIAITVSSFPPKWLSGVEIATYHIATHLAQRGHEVHVITSLDEDMPENSFENGFYIHRLPRGKSHFTGALIFWVDIAREIKRISPDIVHVQSLGIAIPALLTKRLLKIPYVVWGQGSDVYLPYWLIRLTSKIIMRNADSVIALTNDMKRVMQTIYDRDIVVVPNGIEFKEYNIGPPAQNLESPKKSILFVGRLHPVKGIRYLLNAMSIVHRELPEVKLFLVGDGEERGYLESLTDELGVRECIEFVGKVPHERIADYMHHADIFVLPSLSEGFPLTVLEAMACGLPIVATRVGGLSDIIEDGANGYLVEAKKPDEIAERLLMLMRNDVILEKISANNREKAKMFMWDKITGILDEVYRGIIARRECGDDARLHKK